MGWCFPSVHLRSIAPGSHSCGWLLCAGTSLGTGIGTGTGTGAGVGSTGKHDGCPEAPYCVRLFPTTPFSWHGKRPVPSSAIWVGELFPSSCLFVRSHPGKGHYSVRPPVLAGRCPGLSLISVRLSVFPARYPENRPISVRPPLFQPFVPGKGDFLSDLRVGEGFDTKRF